MMMVAEASKRQTMNLVMTLFWMGGLFLLTLGAAIFAYGGVSGADPNLRIAAAPILWDFGIFLLLLGIWGMALMRQDLDPLARLLMYLVSFILTLLIFTAPYLMFSWPRVP